MFCVSDRLFRGAFFRCSDDSDEDKADAATDVEANQRSRIAEKAEMRESLQCEALRLLEASWPKENAVCSDVPAVLMFQL